MFADLSVSDEFKVGGWETEEGSEAGAQVAKRGVWRGGIEGEPGKE